jgi:hypothetical protein
LVFRANSNIKSKNGYTLLEMSLAVFGFKRRLPAPENETGVNFFVT